MSWAGAGKETAAGGASSGGGRSVVADLLEDLERGYGQLQAGEELESGQEDDVVSAVGGEAAGVWGATGVREGDGVLGRGREEGEGGLPRDEADEEKQEPGLGAEGVTVWLEEEETRELLQEVPEVYHTQINDVLLTALGRVCGEWSGSEEVLVDVEGHGREERGRKVDVSRTVGWFTTIYPMVLEGRRGRVGAGAG